MSYNFIYSSSNEYSPYCITSMASLLENNPELEDVRFYILSNGIEELNQEKMQCLCYKHNAEISIVDCKPVIKEIFRGGAKLNFNPSSFLRIFIPQILPAIDKALFIDSDTYINSGIMRLYDTNLGHNLCAMSYNMPIYSEMQKEAGLSADQGYYNAGIILLNLKAWREHRVQERILDYYYANGGSFPTDDQSVINAIVSKQTLTLDYKYNAMIGTFYWSYKKFCRLNQNPGIKTKYEFDYASSHPVIVHFNGPGIRPWEKWCSHPYSKKFRECMYRMNPGITLSASSKGLKYSFAQYIKHKVFDPIERIVNKGWQK